MKAGHLAVAVAAAGLLIGCAAGARQDHHLSSTPAPAAMAADYTCNNPQFLSDQQQFEKGNDTSDQFVDVCGTVSAVLPEKKTRSGHHGYFYVQIVSGVTIEVVSDLDQMTAPPWPWVAAGDTVHVQGRYYYDNAKSQGIDWTHHGTSESWPHAGYVVVNGTLYQ